MQQKDLAYLVCVKKAPEEGEILVTSEMSSIVLFGIGVTKADWKAIGTCCVHDIREKIQRQGQKHGWWSWIEWWCGGVAGCQELKNIIHGKWSKAGKYKVVNKWRTGDCREESIRNKGRMQCPPRRLEKVQEEHEAHEVKKLWQSFRWGLGADSSTLALKKWAADILHRREHRVANVTCWIPESPINRALLAIFSMGASVSGANLYTWIGGGNWCSCGEALARRRAFCLWHWIATQSPFWGGFYSQTWGCAITRRHQELLARRLTLAF